MDKLIIFEKETNTKEILLGYLSEYENISVDKVFDDYNSGIKYVKNNPSKIVLFSMTDDKQLCLKMIKKLSDFNVNVIVLSENYTTSNIIQILRYGAKDFVSKPVIKKELFNSIQKCSQEDVKVLKKSQIISVYSNKGGVGKTAVAVNLAVELTKLTRNKVALVDLNFPIGDITTFLDVKPSVNLSEVINNLKEENDKFLVNACCKYKNTELYILAEPQSTEHSGAITPRQIVELFKYLRKSFSYIIVDIGTNFDKLNLSVLKNSDLILLTTIINLPLIRNCQRCLNLFKEAELSDDKIKIIVNRYLENDEITVEDVEKTLNKNIYWKLPNNYFTIMSSINKGIPVTEVNEKSNITESFTGLASKITEDLFEADLK